MYIAVSNIRAQFNPNSFYLVADVVSSGGTNTTIEVLADDSATASQIRDALAEEARQACRANNEEIPTDAPVMVFGSPVMVS